MIFPDVLIDLEGVLVLVAQTVVSAYQCCGYDRGVDGINDVPVL